jgi:hypothetical protein
MKKKYESFFKNLISYGLGDVVKNLADGQKEIIESVRSVGKTGKLKLELKYKLCGANEIAIAASVKSDLPLKSIQSVTMFVDERNDLYEQDPKNIQTSFQNVTDIEEYKKNAKQV